jgi:hypothetical protein
MDIENWKDIKDAPNYQVSDMGRVRYIKDNCNKLLRITVSGKGYCQVPLKRDGWYKTAKVHRLVGEAFIENIENKPHINHINGIKTDNRACNLEWVTVSENILHAYKTGLKTPSKCNCKTKLSPDDIELIAKVSNEAKKQFKPKDIAKHFGISVSTVYSIKNGESWKHLTLKYVKQKTEKQCNTFWKRCSVCGKPIQVTSNRVKYCKVCAAKVRREQNAKRQQKHRMKLKDSRSNQ